MSAELNNSVCFNFSGTFPRHVHTGKGEWKHHAPNTWWKCSLTITGRTFSLKICASTMLRNLSEYLIHLKDSRSGITWLINEVKSTQICTAVNAGSESPAWLHVQTSILTHRPFPIYLAHLAQYSRPRVHLNEVTSTSIQLHFILLIHHGSHYQSSLRPPRDHQGVDPNALEGSADRICAPIQSRAFITMSYG